MSKEKYLNKIVHADWAALAPRLPDNIAHTAITSIPYYGKRFYPMAPQIFDAHEGCDHEWVDGFQCPTKMAIQGSTETEKYASLVEEGAAPTTSFCAHCPGWKGWFGLEPHPDLFTKHAVDLLRPLRRILRHDFTGRLARTNGSFLLNVGDSYAGSGKGAWKNDELQKEIYVPKPGYDPITKMPKTPAGFKPKDLMLIPHRLAIALHADGWWLRNDIIWRKKAPMPSGGNDRFSSSHEHIFLLAPNKHYFFDMDAVREPYSHASMARYAYAFSDSHHGAKATNNPAVKVGGKIDMNPHGRRRLDVWEVWDEEEIQELFAEFIKYTAEIQDVWEIKTANTSSSHYAAYPEELVEIPIKACTSPQVCASCGAPQMRIVKKKEHDAVAQKAGGADKSGGYGGKSKKHPGGQTPAEIKRNILNSMRYRETIGWELPCKCKSPSLEKAVVIDPFGGTFTTAAVARKLGRSFISCDLSVDYCKIGQERLAGYDASQAEFDVTW